MTIRRFWWIYGGVVGVAWVLMLLMAFLNLDQVFDDYRFEPYPITTPTAGIASPVITKVNPATATPIPLIEQVIAIADIPAGTLINDTHIGLRTIPLDMAIVGGYTQVVGVIGKVASVSLIQEQVITANLLENAGLAPDIYATATRDFINMPLTTTPDPNAPYQTLPIPTSFQMEVVVVPAFDLPAGTIITPDDVIVVTMPIETIPDDLPDNLDLSFYYGKRTRIDLPRNHPVLSRSLVNADSTEIYRYPLPENACVAQVNGTTYPALFGDFKAMTSVGRIRTDTEYLIIGRQYGMLELALPSGLPIGWATAIEFNLSGDCAAYQ